MISCQSKSSSCSRIEFRAADKELLMAKFGMLITGTRLIKEATVKAAVDADPELATIKWYGIYRLTEKIRTERKKFNRERK